MSPKRAYTEATGAGSSIEIETSAKVVWEVLLNIEAYNKLYKSWTGVRNLTPKKSLNPIEAGAKFEQTRILFGRENSYVTSATEVDHSIRKVSYVTTFYGCTATTTATVDALEDSKCRLTATYCMIPDGWRGRLFLWLNKTRLRLGDKYDEFLQNLEDLKYAAETGVYKYGNKLECNTSVSED